MIVWHLLSRGLHWIVAIPVLSNFFTDGDESLHHNLGYAALAGVIARLVWGFFAKDEASYAFFKNRSRRTFWTYLVIWSLVIALAVTGYMMGMDRFWGDEWLHNLHDNISNTLQVFVGIHLCGLIIDSIKYKRKTWLAMITGKR